jgi:hypothetical protein
VDQARGCDDRRPADSLDQRAAPASPWSSTLGFRAEIFGREASRDQSQKRTSDEPCRSHYIDLIGKRWSKSNSPLYLVGPERRLSYSLIGLLASAARHTGGLITEATPTSGTIITAKIENCVIRVLGRRASYMLERDRHYRQTSLSQLRRSHFSLPKASVLGPSQDRRKVSANLA